MEIILLSLLFQDEVTWIDQGTGWESSTDWIVCGGNYTEIAQWIANQYNVSFDDNGADSGNVSDSTATYDSNFTLPESGYKKKGYKFLGWSTNENATSPPIKQTEIPYFMLYGQKVISK